MLQLKLADYGGKKEKFERFSELGSDFVFGGDFILFHNPEEVSYKNYLNDPSVINTTILASNYCQVKFFKDKKDPLNRFDGLFNGRTYGKGRFVLISNLGGVCEQDDVFLNVYTQKKRIARCQEDSYYTSGSAFFCLGNLHEKPELWEGAKCPQ